jgi:molecular chaperone GrpE
MDANSKNDSSVAPVEQTVEGGQTAVEQTSMEKALDGCRKESKEWQEKFLRVSADFENYRRRMDKEQMLWADQAHIEVLTELLRVVDDVDRAVRHHEKNEADQEFVRVLNLLWQNLYKLLDRFGVSEITDVTVFDPEKHEAIARVMSEKHTTEDVVEIVQRGYKKGERVIRPTKVIVAQ